MNTTKKETNYQIAITTLTNARKDHYDGENAIYRLAARKNVPVGISQKKLQNYVGNLVDVLSVQDVIANKVNIHKGFIEVEFYPKGYQMVMTKGQYAGLHLEFAQFIEKTKIIGLEAQKTFLEDEPDYSVRAVANELVNFFPEFNSKCFGTSDRRDIEVNSCSTDQVWEVA
ncbi:hypothetical protein R3398_20785 [Rossellomorea marisflavi]|uniref:hypothetical protein n=1 Tax=Rossellomorea marisflavi TaxID=189381 RepID=UPI00296FE5AA|nr:hypothetical protein [Rossellomorea marisflavi]MDW4528785.1 hypothetical protein [Rossellomorea marisflavi]